MLILHTPLTKSNNLSKSNPWITPNTPCHKPYEELLHKIRQPSQRRNKIRVHYNELSIQTAVLNWNDDESIEIRCLQPLMLTLTSQHPDPYYLHFWSIYTMYKRSPTKIPFKRQLEKNLATKFLMQHVGPGQFSRPLDFSAGSSTQGRHGAPSHFPVSSSTSFFRMHLGPWTLNLIPFEILLDLYLDFKVPRHLSKLQNCSKILETSPTTKTHVISTKH